MKFNAGVKPYVAAGVRRRLQSAGVAAALVIGLVVAVSVEAGATSVTTLNNTTFLTNSISSGWAQPTASSGTNGACLTAGPTSPSSVVPNCSPTVDSSGSGALRLTTNGGTLVGSTYYGVSMPTGQGLDINFASYQYNGSGADGISFSLAAVNPAAPAAPTTTGPTGGSLGYSPNGSINGLPYGYLGLGLDVYGNYENTTYSGSGCTVPSGLSAGTAYPESVTARGPGNNLAGYCILTSTAQTYHHSGAGSSGNTVNNLGSTQGASGEYLDNAAATTRSAVAVPVEIVLNPSGTAAPAETSGLTVPANSYLVAYKALNASGWQSISGALPTTSNNSTLATFPSSWIDPTTNMPYQLALGWTSSTGGSTEIHELNNFSATSFNGPVPEATVTSTDNQSGEFLAGGSTSFTVTPGLSASGGNESDTVTAVDTFPAGITPGTASGTGWTCSTSGQKVTCTYTPSGAQSAGTTFPAITIPATVSASATGSLTSTAVVSSPDGLYGQGSDTGNVYKPSASGGSATWPNMPSLSVTNLPPAATGTITFSTGSTPLCVAILPATSCTPASALEAPGSYPVSAVYSGDGNYSGATLNTSMTVVKDTTTTTVSAAPTTLTYGNESATTFTVSVVGANAESPTNGETVSVSAGCTATLSGGTGTCTVANTQLPAGGPTAVSATYGGDADLSGSTGNAAQSIIVSKDTSATSLTASPATETYGSEASTTFTVHVATGNNEATPNSGETVVVHVGPATCTATLTPAAPGASGTCSLANSALPVGPYTASAQYGGDADIQASPTPGTAAFSVTGAATTTTLSLSTPSTTYGNEGAETFTVTVSSSQGTPSGTATINSSAGALCTVTLVAGSGHCSLSPVQLPVGSISGVVATYTAAGNFAGSVSSPSQSFTVGADSTTTAVTPLPNSAPYGGESATTFTATVTSNFHEVIPVSGETLAIHVGSASCTATLVPGGSGGAGSCAIANSALPAGAYTAAAQYGGDADLSASASPGTSSYTVTAEPTTTTISQLNTNIVYGNESVDLFTVTVNANDGATVPDGETVLVSAGTASCDVTLHSGTGTCAIGDSALGAGGPIAISAAYPGDANLQASSGNTTSGVTVAQDGTATSLSAVPGAQPFGGEAATTFSVGVATGNGEPLPATGEVVTVNVGTASCLATLTAAAPGGSGSCSIGNSDLPVGSYTASATYSGDGDLAASPSAATAPFAVNSASTTTTLGMPPTTTYGTETTQVFSVNVMSSGGTPTGTATVQSGASVLCTATLTAGSGQCALTSTQLSAGTIANVSATYNGDASFSSSASASAPSQSFIVTPDTTTTTLSASPSPATYGHETATTFTVDVTTANGEPIPAGGETVPVTVGSSGCVVTLTPAGQGGSGTCTIGNTDLAAGSYSATAGYAGDADLSGSSTSGSAPFSVSSDSTTTTMTALPSTEPYGHESATTFTVDVATANGEPIPASGETVAVHVGSTTCTATLAPAAGGGSGTCTIGDTDLPAGPYTASAIYGGDSSLSASPSAGSAAFTVAKDATTTAVTAAPATEPYGHEAATTFAVDVTTANGEPIPSSGETVAVHVGSTTCSVTLAPAAGGGSGTCTIADTSLPAGSFTADAMYSGDADLAASPSAGTVGFAISQDGTVTTISATPGSATYGHESATTFTVNVATANGEPIPASGETVPVDVGTASCTATLTPAAGGGSGTCTIADTALAVGSYTASATYGGDASLAASPSPATVPFSVGLDATVTTVTAAPGSATYGQESATVFTVDVTTAHGEPIPSSGETVLVHVGSATCTATLTPAAGGGSGTCALGDTDLPAGPYTASATYGGDASLAASSNAGTAAFTFTSDATTTTLTAAPGSSAYGNESATSFTVGVATAHGEAIAGTGETVTVHVGAASCTATLTPGAPGGTGSCSIPDTALPVGSATATALYGGDASLSASPTTASAPFAVTKDATTTQLAVMPSSAAYGGEASTTFGVAVVTNYGEALPATGETVTITVGPTSCVATLSPIAHGALGVCSIADTGLPAGSYGAHATYGGDADLLASPAAATAGFSVSPDGTVTAITANPATEPYGHEASTTFTVTVATHNGEPIPAAGEQVTVDVGSSSCVVTLTPSTSGGQGSCALPNEALPTGTYTASATYGGDASLDPSAVAATTTFIVTKALPVLTQTTTSPNPATNGQNVTYTATGLPSNATGTITFTIGTTVLCTATLPATSCPSTKAPVGTDPIVAAYSGDSNYAGTVAVPAILVVNAIPVIVGVSGSGAMGHSINIPIPAPSGSGPFTYTVTSQPSSGSGTCAISSSGVLTFTPAPGFSGPASCAYTVTDANGLTSAPATATITVAAAGDPVPAAHTGEPWAGWPYWAGLAIMLLFGLGLLKRSRRLRTR